MKEWKIIVVLVALVIFLFTHQYHHINMVYGFIFAPMILYMPGVNVGTQQDLKDVQFSVLFFIIACMGIGSAGSAVGFGQYVSVSIVPMLQNVSQTTFLCATYLSGVLLNFLMTPLAVLASFGLPFAQICQDLNFNLEPMFYIFYQGTAQALAEKFIVFRDEYGAVSRLLLELIRAEALARGYHIITCPCAMHPEDKIDHILIPELRLAFLTDNRWHPVQLPGMQAVRCTRFLDRENLAGYRARLRFNERAAAELLEQATALMAQAKSCHDELETYYRTTVDFAQVDEAAARCAELFGLEAPSPDC